MHMLANTASNYFSPTLTSVCEKLNLAYDIAGVTFLAFGNGAPDFFSLLASFSGEANPLVGLGALLGGSVFVCTVVVGTIAILCPCEVPKQNFLRDINFHILATVCVTVVAVMQDIYLGFAITFFVVYAFYVFIVGFTSWYRKRLKKQKKKNNRDESYGDIPLTTMKSSLDNEGFQFAFWHKERDVQTKNQSIENGIKIFSSSSPKNNSIKMDDEFDDDNEAENISSDYSFLILPDYLADGKHDEMMMMSDETDDFDNTINASGGYTPNFDSIIQDDYYASSNSSSNTSSNASSNGQYVEVKEANGSIHNKQPNGMKNNWLNQTTRNQRNYQILSDDVDDMEIEEHMQESQSRDGKDQTMIHNELLKESLLSHTDMMKRSTVPSSNDKLPKLKYLKRKKYLNVISSLYWKQWSVRRKFQKQIELSQWWKFSTMNKLIFLCHFPFDLIRDLTIPTLDTNHWSKFYAICQPTASAIFTSFLFGYLNQSIHQIPFVIICIMSGIIPAVLIYIFTHQSRPPSGRLLSVFWSLWAFVMCILWTYTLAGELIICLSAIGYFLHLPASFLGLTILAWGNSVGDFFTNVSVAQQGYGEMAIAGCYGGPIFNILVGLGVSLIYCSFKSYPSAFSVQLDSSSKLSLLFLYIALSTTIIIVVAYKYTIGRSIGIYLISLYVLYTICQGILLFW